MNELTIAFRNGNLLDLPFDLRFFGRVIIRVGDNLPSIFVFFNLKIGTGVVDWVVWWREDGGPFGLPAWGPFA